MTLVPHPAADLFPMLSDSELRALADDIKANGQAIPVAVLNGTYILDGRNRCAACKLAGVEPITREMQSEFSDDADVIRFIISTNIHRRHLTESQRAAIAAGLANLGHGQHKDQTGKSAGLTQTEAAEQMQVSERLVRDAKLVQRDAPDLAEKVKSGELKVSKAASLARERVRVQPQTDPDRAADSVIDRKEDAEASGYTPKMEKVWAAFSALDAVEQTAFQNRLSKRA